MNRIIITVEPTARTNTIPAVKKALKALKRAGLRCVDTRRAVPEPGERHD